jgi:hypothetical protein
MIHYRLAHWLGIGCIAAISVAPIARAGEQRAIIELFTSQGCSSCPAADKLLGDLGEDHSLVTLSLPIDYWDYLGWKDTLALPGHAARQRAYASARGDREVYTPQVVVNGVIHALGSDKAAIERAIVKSRSNPETMAVPVKLDTSGAQVKVSVASAPSAVHGLVWICGVKKAEQVHIGRGENRGRTITYHNVVRGWRKLGEWEGKPASWQISLSDLKPNIDEAAVIVQEQSGGKPGRVLGAAIIPLH